MVCSLVVTIYKPFDITFENSAVYPHNVFIGALSFSDQTSILSLNNIKWLVLTMDMNCVLWEVGANIVCVCVTGMFIHNTLRSDKL